MAQDPHATPDRSPEAFPTLRVIDELRAESAATIESVRDQDPREPELGTRAE